MIFVDICIIRILTNIVVVSICVIVVLAALSALVHSEATRVIRRCMAISTIRRLQWVWLVLLMIIDLWWWSSWPGIDCFATQGIDCDCKDKKCVEAFDHRGQKLLSYWFWWHFPHLCAKPWSRQSSSLESLFLLLLWDFFLALVLLLTMLVLVWGVQVRVWFPYEEVFLRLHHSIYAYEHPSGALSGYVGLHNLKRALVKTTIAVEEVSSPLQWYCEIENMLELFMRKAVILSGIGILTQQDIKLLQPTYIDRSTAFFLALWTWAFWFSITTGSGM